MCGLIARAVVWDFRRANDQERRMQNTSTRKHTHVHTHTQTHVQHMHVCFRETRAFRSTSPWIGKHTHMHAYTHTHKHMCMHTRIFVDSTRVLESVSPARVRLRSPDLVHATRILKTHVARTHICSPYARTHCKHKRMRTRMLIQTHARKHKHARTHAHVIH